MYSVKQWKELSPEIRDNYLRDTDKFNPYTEEAYKFLYSLGEDLITNSEHKIKRIKVLNRFGELILGAVVSSQDSKKLNPEYKFDFAQAVYDEYYGFTIYYLDEESED
jgi:hypothetical protein